MGWGHCGTDSRGRQIGYAIPARCDHKGCKARIDRGLSYACGGMHGTTAAKGDWQVCEGYFCSDHLDLRVLPGADYCGRVCTKCAGDIDFFKVAQISEMVRKLAPMLEDQTLLDDLPDDEEGEQFHALLQVEGLAPQAVQAIYLHLEEWDELHGAPLLPQHMTMSQLKAAERAYGLDAALRRLLQTTMDTLRDREADWTQTLFGQMETSECR